MKKRVSKFELLRIIAMYLIVLHHSIVHGVLNVEINSELKYPSATILATILGTGGKIGVFVFVLITGYFMINSKISLGKVIKLWLPIFFWSIILFGTLNLFYLHSFSVNNLIKSIFTILFNQYWFMTVYFFMYCMVPLLNIVVNSLDNLKKILYFTVLGILIVISQFAFFYGGNHGFVGSYLLAFCFVYCIGALIHKNNILKNRSVMKDSNIVLLVLAVVDILVISIFIVLSTKLHIAKLLIWAQAISFDSSTLMPILLSIGIFNLIGSMNIEYHSSWNKVATVMFGIYLISDNNYSRNFIWNGIFSMNHMIDKNPLWILIYTIIVSAIVFIVCGCLEYLRKLVFGRLENKICKYVNDQFLRVILKLKW